MPKPLVLAALNSLQHLQAGDDLDLGDWQLPVSAGDAGQLLTSQGNGQGAVWSGSAAVQWLPCAPGSSIRYYVDPSGSDDTGDGTSGNPWYSPGKVISEIQRYAIADNQEAIIVAGCVGDPPWFWEPVKASLLITGFTGGSELFIESAPPTSDFNGVTVIINLATFGAQQADAVYDGGARELIITVDDINGATANQVEDAVNLLPQWDASIVVGLNWVPGDAGSYGQTTGGQNGFPGGQKLSHPYGHRISLRGELHPVFDCTVVALSGSAEDWHVTIEFPQPEPHICVGMHCCTPIISARPPVDAYQADYMLSVFVVESVDTPNNRVTLFSASKASYGPPVDTVACICFHYTQFTTQSEWILAMDRQLKCENFTLSGGGVSEDCFRLERNAHLQAQELIITDAQKGIRSATGSFVTASSLGFYKCSVAGLQMCLSNVSCVHSSFSACGCGVMLESSFASLTDAMAFGNTRGVSVLQSKVSMITAIVGGNTEYGIVVGSGSAVDATDLRNLDPGSVGVFVRGNSIVYCPGHAEFGIGTFYDPNDAGSLPASVYGNDPTSHDFSSVLETGI